MFPVVHVSGSAYERGRQYGEQARDRIRGSLAAYATSFRYFAGWDWATATDQARRFVPAIEDFGAAYVEEMRGMAAGAHLDFADVLAANLRTEVMYSARMRQALSLAAPAECTTFAVTAADGRVVAGQNWDWAPFALDTCVVVRAEPDEGPAYVTVVEAGLLAKVGLNSEGLAVMTNAMACTEDVGEPGVPYHVMLRALLDADSVAAGLDTIRRRPRASSANYLLADETGHAVDVEARPGGPDQLHLLQPDARGCVLHTNHFTSPDFDSVDYARLVATTTDMRLGRVTELVDEADDPADLTMFAAAMSDHRHRPNSLCRHPDETLPAPEQSMTVTSVLMDVRARRFEVSQGPPCERGFEPVTGSFLAG